jgi:glycine cleavage system H protein
MSLVSGISQEGSEMKDGFYETTIDKFMLHVKKGLQYTLDDVWVKKKEAGYRIGLTDLAQRMGGDIVFIEYPPQPSEYCAGEILANYETIKAVLDVKAPFGCRVNKYNEAVEEAPELINEDPYGEGWIAEVTPTGGVDGLLTAEEYFEAMTRKAQAELKKIKRTEDD